MSAELTDLLGRPGPPSSGALPELTTVCVADGSEVEPLLRRATADLSSLTLRLGAANRRAAAAEASAEAPVSPDGSRRRAGA